MPNSEEDGAEAEDVTLVESTTPTRTATPAPSTTGTAIAAGATIEPNYRMGVAAPPNLYSNPTTLH
jgi:hypothetical protein